MKAGKTPSLELGHFKVVRIEKVDGHTLPLRLVSYLSDGEFVVQSFAVGVSIITLPFFGHRDTDRGRYWARSHRKTVLPTRNSYCPR